MRGPTSDIGARRSPTRRLVAGPIAALSLVVAMVTGCSVLKSSAPERTQKTQAPLASASAARSTRTTPTRAPKTTTTTTTIPPTTTTTIPPTTTTTLEVEQPGWTPVSYVGAHIAIDRRSVVGPGGATVTVFRFRADRVHFDLHVGSGDPPANLASLPAVAQPAVSAAEVPVLLAAFNGGFKVGTGAGGVEIDGQTLASLQNGVASFAIDANGTGHVGVWGQTLPTPGEQVTSVRQCLPPLVLNSQPSPNVSDIGAWGATLGGGASVARSSLGEDAAGNILYAGSMSAFPSDLASALISSGATTAMELDINPEWVQLAFSATVGGPLQIGIPGQNRPADQYPAGWTRDFITVLAGPPA
jgi:hypothetical protein